MITHRRPSVVVVGSYITDLMSRTPRMPVPGETVLGGPFKYGPGGKGSNQAVAAARAGAAVTMVTKVGSDYFGDLAVENLKREGISTDYVFRDPHLHTGAALIIVETGGENMIVVAIGANETLTCEEVERARESIGAADALLLQLESNLEATERAAEIARSAGVLTILNPAPYRPAPASLVAKADIITPNETEASGLAGMEIRDAESAREAGMRLLTMGPKAVIVTMGASGALLVAQGRTRQFLPPKVDAVDTTGAGDAFSGGLTCALAEGRSLDDAVRFANAVAARSVTKVGTAPAMPFRSEVDAMLADVSG